jgi:hypothetical protein
MKGQAEMDLNREREPLLLVLREMQARLTYYATFNFEEDDPKLAPAFRLASGSVEDLITQLGRR